MTTIDPFKTNMTAEDLELVALEEELKAEEEKAKQLAESMKATPKEELQEKLRRAKLEAANLEAIKKISAESGKKLGVDFARIDCPDGNMILVKKVSSATYKMFSDAGKVKSEEIQSVAEACVIFPSDKSCRNSLFEEYPSIVPECTLAAFRLAGLKEGVIQKK